MRFTGVLGVVCILAAPALGEPVTYTFDLTSGSLMVILNDLGGSVVSSSTSGMAGTFAVTIHQSDGHIGESDTFLLEGSSLLNTDAMVLGDGMGLATAHLAPGSVRLLDFAPDGPDHIGSGGTALVDADAYVEITLEITGGYNDSLSRASWAGELLPFELGFTTSVAKSDVVAASLTGTYSYLLLIPDVSLAFTVDLVVDLVGTAHVVPEPATSGLAVLTVVGLSGGAARLRRRR